MTPSALILLLTTRHLGGLVDSEVADKADMHNGHMQEQRFFPAYSCSLNFVCSRTGLDSMHTCTDQSRLARWPEWVGILPKD